MGKLKVPHFTRYTPDVTRDPRRSNPSQQAAELLSKSERISLPDKLNISSDDALPLPLRTTNVLPTAQRTGRGNPPLLRLDRHP
jgi:hypothetical protein